jgi:hypothetical protein
MARAKAIKFVVGSRSSGKCSYAWRVWKGNRSFYVKPLPQIMADLKISLHGPDPAKGYDKSGYKLARDWRATERVRRAGEVFSQWEWPDSVLFPGWEIRPGVDLVVRFRFTWNLFTPGVESAEPPPDPKVSEMGALIPVPGRGRAVDVDLFVCHEEPYWPNEQLARRDKACLGPMFNLAGQALTGVIHDQRLADHPSPVPERAPSGPHGEPAALDRVRGVGAALDSRGFLWVQELWLSRSAMQARKLSIFRNPL